jgi:hypothetical protein
VKNRRFRNVAAEQFLLWLVTKCGAIEADDALAAVLAAERGGMAERVQKRLESMRQYHAKFGPLLGAEVLNAQKVLRVLGEEAGTEPS